MIAASSLGSSFGRLANYLGGDAERVGWIETRNLEEGKDWGDGAGARAVDWREAAAEMSDEVAGRGVEQPVYHVAIAFDPDDLPTEAEVRAAADRALRDLGLEDHQALVVRHTDQPHAHVHLMVNRVGPDGRVWSPWRERLRLRDSMEAQERELGVRWTGRNRDLGREPAGDRAPTGRAADRPARDRAPSASGPDPCGFAAEVRSRALADLRESRTWAELDGRLAAHGWRVERRGQGAVVTDGERETKLSSVSRTVSRGRLEKRLGPLRDRDRGRGAASETTPARSAARPAGRRGRPRKGARGPSRAVRARRAAVLSRDGGRGGTAPSVRANAPVLRSGRPPSPGRPGPRGPGAGLLAGRAARGGVAGLGGGERDTDVERQLPRLAADLATTVARRGGLAGGTAPPSPPRKGEGRTPRSPSLGERTLAVRAARRDDRPGGRLDRLAALVRERGRAARLGAENVRARVALDHVHGRAAQAAGATRHRAHEANRAFTDALGRVYADPVRAGEAFDRLAEREGPEAAARAMAGRPERFGPLRATETRRAFGLVRGSTTDAARAYAAEAAQRGAAYARARREHAEAAERAAVVRRSEGRSSADPVARAVGLRVERTERAVGGRGRGAAGRRLRALDQRIGLAARSIGRTLPSQGAGAGTPARKGKRRAPGAGGRSKQALAARVGTAGVRVVAQVVKAAGRSIGRE